MYSSFLCFNMLAMSKYDVIILRIPQIISMILHKKIKLFLKRISCFNQIYNHNKNPLNIL